MAEFLFEIFCEEIPARMQVRAGQDLEKALTGGLKQAGLSVENLQIFTGPRRLVYTADIPLQSPDINEERKGPRVGSPEQALAGFLRGAGLKDISEAETRSDKKGEHYVAVIRKEGVSTHAILTDLIPQIMTKFPWPKSMKSGASAFRWVRPLQSMICLLDEVVVLVEVGGVTAGDMTEGHRRLGAGAFPVQNFAQYKERLEGEGHVLLSAKDRKAKISKQAKQACEAKGLALVEDEGLLNEVAGLAEWPVVILGDMDPEFLELPSEVIRLSMRTHQKYFAVKDPKTGKLAPNFIVVANQIAPDGGKAIAQGNSRVLSARLADAQFFQTEDAKKDLIEYYNKLDTVVFHKKLGSVRDKAERVSALARELAPKVGAEADAAVEAAKLAKCDLVTQTVIEFTSLQGQIGRLMYEREALAKNISSAERSAIGHAIEDHYKPQGPSDKVPSEPISIAVALADKLDSLVGFWAIDEKPTGSKDPFALRRAALGVVRIILENDVRVQAAGLGVVLECVNSYSLARAKHTKVVAEQIGKPVEKRLPLKKFEHPFECFNVYMKSSGNAEHFEHLLAFILDRLKVYLRDQNYRHDIIDAVYAKGGDDLVDLVNRIKALQSFIDTGEGKDLLAGYKRAANILKAEAKKGALPEGMPEAPAVKESLELFTALEGARPKIETALVQSEYGQALAIFANLRAPIDVFFKDVQVITDDTAVKQNNLRLLKLIRDTAQRIAEFDLISG